MRNIQVLTLNTFQCKDMQGIIRLLQEHSPDIICLQEVIERDGSNTAAVIAEKLGGYRHQYFQATPMTRLGFPQGNAILCQHPIVSSHCHWLGTKSLGTSNCLAENELRNMVEIVVTVDGTNITVLTTHLAYSPFFAPSKIRCEQIERILEFTSGKERLILAGDLNEISGTIIKNIETRLRNAVPRLQPTFITPGYEFSYEGHAVCDLIHRLDHIFVSHDIEVIPEASRVLPTRVSDHLPVIATVTI